MNVRPNILDRLDHASFWTLPTAPQCTVVAGGYRMKQEIRLRYIELTFYIATQCMYVAYIYIYIAMV